MAKKVTTIKQFAKTEFDMKEEDMLDILIDMGILTADEEVKSKYVKQGLLDEDGNVLDTNKLGDMVEKYQNESGDDDDDDDDEDEKSSKKSKSDDSDDEEVEDLDFDSLAKVVGDFEYSTREEICELIKLLADKMVDFEANDEAENESNDVDDDDVSDEDDEIEDDDEDDSNKEGKYRGWKIVHEGKFAVATKGKDNVLKAKLASGNIREKIDNWEDEDE